MTAPSKRRFRWRRIIAIAVLIVLLVAAAAVTWLFWPQQVLPEADAALVSSQTLSIDESGGRITFTPTEGADVGLILYPGGKVPAEAYAPTARLVAEQGYLVVLVSMPFNFAVFDANAASGVIADHPEITQWAIGGHSLGGAMAGQFIASNPDAVDGLVLWAAYSAADASASGVDTAVVYGTLDSGRERFTSVESLALLPPDPVITAIEGGNHANFGSYSGQPNDPPATISRTDQQAQVVAATLELLDAVGDPVP